MKKYMDCQAVDDRLIVGNANFGDWLNIDDPTGNEFISTAYWCGMTKLLSRIAAILGKNQDAKALDAFAARIQNAFQTEFLDSGGKLKEHSQTALLLALHFELLPEPSIIRTVKDLVENIKERKTHLSTGFLGTPLLLSILSRYGHTDLAYDLLLQTGYPGWLYPVTQGATTMWERWNSYTRENGFGNVGMNSFNHYAYGAVAEWFYQNIGGIRPDYSSPDNAGFKHFILEPEPGRKLTCAHAEYRSAYGMIKSAWRRQKLRWNWRFTIPANTTAQVILPYRTMLRHSDNLPDAGRNGGVFSAGTYEVTMEEDKT
jgi:alpha-L-rhamnosidase